MGSISRVSLVEQVTDQLRGWINSEDVLVGDKLPNETAICKMYGVSRTTVREALRMLQALGYVNLIPNRGAFVKNKNQKAVSELGVWISSHLTQVSDAFEFRAMIEPEAAALAAGRITEEEKVMLTGAHSMFREHAKEKNQEQLVRYDELFHECIINATHNTFLIGVNRILVESIHHFRGRSFAEDKGADLALGGHEEIYQAIMKGDARTASSAMRRHVRTNINLIDHYSHLT